MHNVVDRSSNLVEKHDKLLRDEEAIKSKSRIRGYLCRIHARLPKILCMDHTVALFPYNFLENLLNAAQLRIMNFRYLLRYLDK